MAAGERVQTIVDCVGDAPRSRRRVLPPYLGLDGL
jgi:hypothetical protein